MTPKTHFIVFSDDWGIHPSSAQHLFGHIVKENRVSWINTIGMRDPQFNIGDLRKAQRKISGMFGRTNPSVRTNVSNDVAVFQPMMIPFNKVSAIRQLNQRLVSRALRRLESTTDSGLPIIVTTVPNACDYVDAVPSQRIVYYCVDDFSEWPGLDQALVLEMEEKLIDKADIFIATSQRLYERLAKTGKPTHLLSHGVDIDLFSSNASVEHALLGEIPNPRIGYFGLFDERSDQTLIAKLASKMPGVSFVIAGRVETSVDRLSTLENVHFLGPIDYFNLPSLIKGLRVLFMPYRVDRLSESLSPLKLKEYMATGLPVISTPISAALEVRDKICVAESQDDWEHAISGFLGNKNPDARGVMVEALSSESWGEKAKEMVMLCSG